jgi:hypothetical protein
MKDGFLSLTGFLCSPESFKDPSTSAIYEVKGFMRNMFINLAQSTWGYCWPDACRNFTMYESEWCWYAKGNGVAKSPQFYGLVATCDANGRPVCFNVWHAMGITRTRDATEAALGLAMKLASRAGPAIGRDDSISLGVA